MLRRSSGGKNERLVGVLPDCASKSWRLGFLLRVKSSRGLIHNLSSISWISWIRLWICGIRLMKLKGVLLCQLREFGWRVSRTGIDNVGCRRSDARRSFGKACSVDRLGDDSEGAVGGARRVAGFAPGRS